MGCISRVRWLAAIRASERSLIAAFGATGYAVLDPVSKADDKERDRADSSQQAAKSRPIAQRCQFLSQAIPLDNPSLLYGVDLRLSSANNITLLVHALAATGLLFCSWSAAFLLLIGRAACNWRTSRQG